MQKIPDNGVDDKCPCCGEWTLRAFRYYGGLYNDGTEMDYCTCQGRDENDNAWPSHIWSRERYCFDTEVLAA